MQFNLRIHNRCRFNAYAGFNIQTVKMDGKKSSGDSISWSSERNYTGHLEEIHWKSVCWYRCSCSCCTAQACILVTCLNEKLQPSTFFSIQTVKVCFIFHITSCHFDQNFIAFRSGVSPVTER